MGNEVEFCASALENECTCLTDKDAFNVVVRFMVGTVRERRHQCCVTSSMLWNDLWWKLLGKWMGRSRGMLLNHVCGGHRTFDSPTSTSIDLGWKVHRPETPSVVWQGLWLAAAFMVNVNSASAWTRHLQWCRMIYGGGSKGRDTREACYIESNA
jgi:hypothetical protein